MTREEILKKFEFDIRFKYSPVYFRVRSIKLLKILYDLVSNTFKLHTNDSYVDFLIDINRFRSDENCIDCVFLINLNLKTSDVYSTNHYMQLIEKGYPLLDLQELPDYLNEI